MCSLQSFREISEAMRIHIWAVLIAFFMAIFALFRFVVLEAGRKLPSLVYYYAHRITCLSIEQELKEEFQPHSPTQRVEPDSYSTVLRRVGELEEKISILQTKSLQMPTEKEELLNAAISRVDALEAELIATKKALHEALMRQEELLAYIDGQQVAKSRKRRCCW
ncbi:hypothetical protein Ancab_016237 [Ancistrocladus abbreviatus]